MALKLPNRARCDHCAVEFTLDSRRMALYANDEILSINDHRKVIVLSVVRHHEEHGGLIVRLVP